MRRAVSDRGSGRSGRAGSTRRAAAALVAVCAGLAVLPVTAADEEGVVHMRLAPIEQARGRGDAPVTVVEFTDYQCPYCRRFQARTWPLIERSYVDTGKVRFIVRDLPLAFHSAARPAAQAAHCAGEQGRFWPMHAALLRSETKLDDGSLAALARALRLDMAQFRACVAGNKYSAAIERNAAEAAALGIRGTPTFVIGRASGGELEGERLAGALPYEDFAAAIDALLGR